ncbi:MAG: transcription termination/antitermination factor NusG [Bacteroidales bacterium]|nr:transcription termination/antitermination factor NusG [Bacteroidales bacterium]
MAEADRKWYVIKAVTGTEKKVKNNIEIELELTGKTDMVTRVLIPTEKVYHTTKSGKKVYTERNYFPSYIFVEAEMTGEIRGLLLNVPGVLGFVGCKRKTDPPVALRPAEVSRLLGKVDELMSEDSAYIQPFVEGEEIRVIDGPFNTFNGIIESIDTERKKLKIMVKIFGRKTPVELNFMQVEKI